MLEEVVGWWPHWIEEIHVLVAVEEARLDLAAEVDSLASVIATMLVVELVVVPGLQRVFVPVETAD